MSETYWGRVLLQDQKEKKFWVGAIIYYRSTIGEPAKLDWKYEVKTKLELERMLELLPKSKYTKIKYIVHIYAKPK